VLKDIMCGDEAAAARSMLQITYPVCDHLPGSGREDKQEAIRLQRKEQAS
jgi:hypothetical protein